MPAEEVFVLGEQERIFALEYCSHFNGSRAARQAGYSKDCAHDTAWRLLRKPEIQHFIDTALKTRARALRIDGEDVVHGIRESVRRAIEKGDEKTAIKGWELLGKFCGIFERDNRQKSGTDAEAIRQRLRERGFDLERLQAPLVPPPSEN